MSNSRQVYMRDYQRERRKRKNVRLLCVELFDQEEHKILDDLKDHSEKTDITIRDLVVESLKRDFSS